MEVRNSGDEMHSLSYTANIKNENQIKFSALSLIVYLLRINIKTMNKLQLESKLLICYKKKN